MALLEPKCYQEATKQEKWIKEMMKK